MVHVTGRYTRCGCAPNLSFCGARACDRQIYPLWLCPFVLPADPGFLQPASGKEQMYIDIGAYGVPRTVNFDAVKTCRRIEKFVISIGG